jgi:hypothetical protein
VRPRIEPHFILWNYFLSVQLQQGSGVEAASLGSVGIFIRSSHGVHPYFLLLMYGPPDGWRKVWFFLTNDADTPLPMFMGSHHIPQPN